MAIVSATITVDFTANYAGDHRVCWRILGSVGPYDCSTVVNCTGGATTCQAIFNADVNTTSCDGTVTFEGYVQAACEDIASLNGRLAFTVDFIPTVICKRNVVTCANVGIESITVDTAGEGYPSAPVVTITGDGVGATAISTISDDSVDTITLPTLPDGTGYIDGVYVDYPTTGGTGTGFTIDFTVMGGEVVSIEGTNSISEGGFGGIGYTGGGGDAPTPDPAGSAGTPSVAMVIVVDTVQSGTLQSITLTAPGSGFTSVPTIGIANTGSTPSTATAILAPCLDWLAVGTDCDSNIVDIADLELGEEFATCIVGALSSTPAEYTVLETGCCIPADTTSDVCFDYHIENTDLVNSHDLQYTACNGIDSVVTLDPSATSAICGVLGGTLGPVELVVTDTGNTCT